MPNKFQERSLRFEQLAAPLERQVYFTCLHMMGKREDAEDCAQEAMLRAYRKLDSFKGEASFSTWMYAIAMRVCLDAIKKRKETVSLDLLRESGWDAAGSEPEAFLQLEEKERKRALKDAMALLPADFLAPLVLVDLQGIPYQEAADALNIPLGTVKSRVSRARQTIFKILSNSRELFVSADRLSDEGRETHGL